MHTVTFDDGLILLSIAQDLKYFAVDLVDQSHSQGSTN